MARDTAHIAGTRAGGVGDPSPATAYGVYMGIRAAARHRLGVDSLKGLRVAVQGVGHVGYYLCRHLAAEGAELTVADIAQDRSEERRVGKKCVRTWRSRWAPYH